MHVALPGYEISGTRSIDHRSSCLRHLAAEGRSPRTYLVALDSCVLTFDLDSLSSCSLQLLRHAHMGASIADSTSETPL